MAGRGGLAVFLMWPLLRIRYVMSSYGPDLCGQVDPFPPFALGTRGTGIFMWQTPNVAKGLLQEPLQENAPKNHARFAGQARFG